MTPLNFLEQLWQLKPEDHYVLIWTLPDKRSHWFREIPAAAEFVANTEGSDVYVGVGLSKDDHGPTRRCLSAEISGIAGLWADLDLHSAAHGKKELPSSIDDALGIISPGMPPTFVLATGNGAHAWWLFKEPLIFETGEDREEAARLVGRWHTLLRLNAAARGWAFDRLSDLARVLRIPGTMNHKDPSNPKPVVVHASSDRRYSIADFEEFLDEAAVPDPEAYARSAKGWTEEYQDTPLVLNLKAEVPQALLDGWMQQDWRFHHTWYRQRPDLKDQSQSGYDLALADFGTEAGLTPQQIVDLIIHHRRLHRQKPRTRQDYFERTLSRASKRGDGAMALPPLPRAPAEPSGDAGTTTAGAEAMQESASPAADPLAAKAALCEYISEVLGVRILRIVKITGKEPTYQIILENCKIELNNLGKLLDQNSVRMAIATATNRLTNRVKPKHWDSLAQTILDALIEIEGGPETQLEGAVRMYLDQYLFDVAFIPTIAGQPSNAIRRPMLLDGQIAINSADFQLFINKTFVQSYSVKAVASMLSAIGAKNIRVRGAKGREQGRWILPATEFDPADFVEKFQREEDAE